MDSKSRRISATEMGGKDCEDGMKSRKVSVAEMWKSGGNFESKNKARAFSDASLVIKDEKKKESVTRYRLCQGIELVVVFTFLLLTWSLLSLPIVFYFLETQERLTNEVDVNMTLNGSNSTLECMNTINFDTKDLRCQLELFEVLSEANCPHQAGQAILVTRDTGNLADQFLQGLAAVGASSSCITEATSFVCLFAYGLCSSTGVYIQPTSGQCEELRDSLCPREWETAITLGIALPDCNQFPSTPANCIQSEETNATSFLNANKTTDSNLDSIGLAVVLECSDGFYQENGSQICIPSCYDFKQYDATTSLIIDVLNCLIAVLGIIAALAILITSCWDYKRMLQFPSILVVYMIIDTIALEIIMIVSFANRGLFCSSRSLTESLQKVTPYCVVTGIIFTYNLLQLAVWWFIHAAVLFWKIMFPFHANSYAEKMKYIHVVCLVLGLVIPLAPVITAMSERAVDARNEADNETSSLQLFLDGGLGFSNFRFPPFSGTPTNRAVTFYSLILPLDILQLVGTTCIILLIWRIRRSSFSRKKRAANPFVVGTAEKKLMILLFYFEILASFALITYTLNSRYFELFIQSISEFFICEQNGYDEENPCSRSDINRYGFPWVSALTYFIFGSFPIVNLTYAVKMQGIKKLCCTRRHKNRSNIKPTISSHKSDSLIISEKKF